MSTSPIGDLGLDHSGPVEVQATGDAPKHPIWNTDLRERGESRRSTRTISQWRLTEAWKVFAPALAGSAMTVGSG
jgi:hypothetical protein